ncbi:hypothetical protein [Streptomyces sp. NPDC127098]|uniref:hypothetical protein n=1 Tax=Streptomyces sp. NPDC127098 TaxID=3347137 RepID=UPI003669813D
MSWTVALPVSAVDETEGLLDLAAFLLGELGRGRDDGLVEQFAGFPLRLGDERVHPGELCLCGVALGHLPGPACTRYAATSMPAATTRAEPGRRPADERYR